MSKDRSVRSADMPVVSTVEAYESCGKVRVFFLGGHQIALTLTLRQVLELQAATAKAACYIVDAMLAGNGDGSQSEQKPVSSAGLGEP